VEHCKNTLKSFYGDEAQESDSYGRIINSRHFKYIIMSRRVALPLVFAMRISVELNLHSAMLVKSQLGQDDHFGIAVAVVCQAVVSVKLFNGEVLQCGPDPFSGQMA